jgi:hypothetical protein
MARVLGATRRDAMRARALGGLVGGIIAGAALISLYAAVARPRWKADIEARLQAESRDESTIQTLRMRAEESERHVQDLESDLASAQSEVARLRLQLDEANRKRGNTNVPRPPRRARIADTPPPLDGFTRCPPGSSDPMCLH